MKTPRVLFVVGLAVTLGALSSPSLGQALFSSSLPPEPAGQRFTNAAFEVASVKENPLSWQEAGPPSTRMFVSGRFVAVRETVNRLILSAYDVRPYQIVGGPAWMENTRFDITAKAPDTFEMSQTRAMVRRLLADRFDLVIKREMRTMSTYRLEWVDSRHKLGSGIRPASTNCAGTGRESSSGAFVAPPALSTCRAAAGWEVDGLFIRQTPLASLLPLLISATGRPVIDKTRLTGKYDVDLKASGLVPGVVQTDVDLNSGEGSSIFTALREQLNMKLVPAKDQVEVLVIERLAQPTPN